ncbi:MAG TPA: neuraminidase-like domain-containing protein [Acidobacteriaceae bacterium]
MNLQGRDLKQDMSGADVRLLHSELAQLGIAIPEAESGHAVFGPGTRDAVMRFQKANNLPSTGVVDQATAQAINRSVAAQAAPVFTVSGKVYGTRSAAMAGLHLTVVDKNAGPDVPLAQGTTDEGGAYTITYSIAPVLRAKKAAPDIQVLATAGNATVASSEVRYNAGASELLDVVLPDSATSALASEHETLLTAVARHYGGSIADLQENDTRSDISYLANKTGWDARAVATASLADQFSRKLAPDVAPQWFYALFRAGLPSAEDALFRTRLEDLRRVWQNAASQGVIPAKALADLLKVEAKFLTLAAKQTLSGKPAAGVSSMGDLLNAAGVSDTVQQTKFASIIASGQDDPEKLWTAVSQALGAQTAAKLQVHGKLAALTVNNAPLIRALSANRDIKDPVELASAGFHKADAWEALLTDAVPVPAEIPGDTLETRRNNYAAAMAAQVRISYPTASMAQMVRGGQLKVPAAQGVAAFLTQHQTKFEIGSQPVEQYIARNKIRVDADTVAGVKVMQRMYQVTSRDETMTTLLNEGITSAYAIAKQDKEAFVAAHSKSLGIDEATRVYDRSTEIRNAALNVAITYMTARNGVPLGALQTPAAGAGSAEGGQILRPQPLGPTAANASDIIAYPTLEQLFGSMDFCSCDECRSIFSPAAYLVDLLQFLDNAADGKRNAQEVLFERRPDIQHLPLTCENTNTPLPYIDIVNETLEYYVANTVQPLSLRGFSGHDTGEVPTEDLMASPQYVMDSAYDTVRTAIFPAPLPFHMPLENMRRLFKAFEVPLEHAMERLRKTDVVERGANPYGWRDILMEAAGFSREEYALLTDSSTGLKALYGFAAATTDAQVADTLSNAKQFCRRVNIAYEELVSLLETHFVNPNSDLVPQLQRLAVPFSALAGLHNGTITDAQFDAMLPTGAATPDPAEFGGDIKAWVRNNDNFARIMGIIVLEDPTGAPAGGCNFDRFEMRYPTPPAGPGDNSTRIGEPEYIRLLRFVRVWRKTGWTIEQTDAALCALFNADLRPLVPADVATLANLDADFARFVPRLGNVMRTMDALKLNVKRDLYSLLACWGPLQTFGPGSLYSKLFLNPAVLRQDPAFEGDGYGHFPGNAAVKLADHRETIRGALTLTAEEYDRIFDSLGFDNNTLANVANLAAIYRRGWLARKLRLSVRELLLLSSLTGLDPFAPPDPPASPMLRLAALVNAMKAQGLKSAAALYLIWNQDLSGKSVPPDLLIDGMVQSLRADFDAVDMQFAVVEDPGGDIARTRMALVYGQEITDALFSMLEGSVVLTAAYVQAAPALDPAITAADPNISWDRFRNVLSRKGILDTTTRDALKNVAGVSQAFKDAVEALYGRGRDIEDSFFSRLPELKPLYDAWVASAGTLEQKRATFLAAFSPELARVRKSQQALQRMATAAGVDVSFAQAILAAARAPLPLHSAADVAKPALVDVTAVGAQGHGARFYFRDTATGTVDGHADVVPRLSYSSTNPLPANPAPGSAISVVLEGRIEAPESGFFNLVITAEPGSTVSLSLAGQAQPLVQLGPVWRNANALELKAGRLYDIVVTVEKVVSTLDVSWESPRRSRETIPPRYLYPPSLFAPFRDVFVRFLKAASLASALKLTGNELAFLASSGWLNTLAVSAPPAAADAAALLDKLEDLLDFARIRKEVSPDDEQLLAILTAPAAATSRRDSLLFTLTHWDTASLDTLLTHFGSTIAGLSDLRLFRRVFDAFQVIQQLGVPAQAAIAAVTNAPDGNLVRSFSAALRARYEESSWRDVVKPVNDTMRSLQRDALVTYILHQMRSVPATAHIDKPDKLFEYFLMDVEMEPCMQTSRIRHALSTVQLFAERCLMNLEAEVSQGSINARRWAWMKRFRVWQVPRKLFVHPENWMETELRDDKTAFFKEIESQLLQSDIDEDTAASALRTYLSRLEEVARLEPCGMHYVEPTATTDDVMHVVARTQGAHRKYFYRRYEHGVWTAWEPVKIDIADNPAVPVLWQDRLLLFHTRIITKGPDSTGRPAAGKSLTSMTTSDIPGTPAHRQYAVLCWSEYHNKTWQPVKTSDLELPAQIDEGNLAYLLTSGQIEWKFLAGNRPLKVIFDTPNTAAYVMHDTHGSPAADYSILPPKPPRRRLMGPNQDFDIAYRTQYGQWLDRAILSADVPPSITEPLHELNDTWNAPFFFADNRHVFLVSSSSWYRPLWDFVGYGVNFGPYLTAPAVIPPLVIEKPPIGPPKPWDKVTVDTGRAVDPAPLQRYITEDAYIRKAIGTTGNVNFNGTLVGPSGKLGKTGNIA